MSRASMATLITRLRRLIGDRAGVEQEWTDDELQDSLDNFRRTYRYLALCPEDSIASGGAVSYLRWNADGLRDWEADVEIVNNTYAVVTPTSADYREGLWIFATQPAYPLYLNGKRYDLCAAAVEVLEEWAARLKQEYDFTVEGTTYKRSQQLEMVLTLAEKYRGLREPVTVTMTRSDMA